MLVKLASGILVTPANASKVMSVLERKAPFLIKRVQAHLVKHDDNLAALLGKYHDWTKL